MTLQVFTAVTGATWESELVGALDRDDHGVTVVRRCVDVSELLAAAATGTGQAALLSGELRRLDVDAVARLEAAGVAVVGLVEPGDHRAAERLHQLGVRYVLPADAEPEVIARALRDAVAGGPSGGHDVADPAAALPRLDEPDAPERRPAGEGRVVAVWGPTGAPGRTTVAVGLADEASRLGTSTLLVDADVYGGVVAQMLGLLDESPGLAGAARQASTGALDDAALLRLAWTLRPRLRVLTGLARADRWPELRPAALEVVLELGRSLATTTVVDCSFALEQDEELAYDTAAPRRNGATLTVLAAADRVVAVGTADPVGLQRLVRGLGDLREAVPGVDPLVVVNRLRATAVPGDAQAEVRAALSRYAGVEQVRFVPLDVPAVDRAVSGGRTLAEAAPSSPARLALTALAAELAGVPAAPPRRRSLLARR